MPGDSKSMQEILREQIFKDFPRNEWQLGWDGHEYWEPQVLLFAPFPYGGMRGDGLLILASTSCKKCHVGDFLVLFSYEFRQGEAVPLEDFNERIGWPFMEYPLTAKGFLEASNKFWELVKAVNINAWWCEGYRWLEAWRDRRAPHQERRGPLARFTHLAGNIPSPYHTWYHESFKWMLDHPYRGTDDSDVPWHTRFRKVT